MMNPDIVRDDPPPTGERSTPATRSKWMRRWTVCHSRDLALEELLDPSPPERPLPELPDAGDPMPERLATVWDGLTDLERLIINGGKGWQRNPWVRISTCIDIFREHGLNLADALGMCRFANGLGSDMPRHAEILRTLWPIGEPGYTGPRNWRWAEHVEQMLAFGTLCQAAPDEIAICAQASWKEAEQHAQNFLEALRRRLWPMCRTEAPEQAVIAATDKVMQEFGVFVDDELLMPVLKKIEDGAKPRPKRRRRLA